MKERTNNKRNKKGFTLAELLVVVAILAILVAVSIPIFTGRLEASKKTVCDANKQALRHHIAVTMMEEDSTSTSALGDLLEAYIKSDEAICPRGGKYSISGSWEAGFDIYCDIHDLGEGTINGTNTRTSLFKELSDLIKDNDNLKKYFNEQGNKYIDSGANSTRKGLVQAEVDELLKVSKEEVKTWALGKNGTTDPIRLYWTQQDISKMENNATLNTLCYDFDTKKYYVTEMGLEKGDEVYGPYKKMRYKQTVEPEGGYDTYEAALEAYKDLKK